MAAGRTYTPLATTTLSSAAGSVTFSSISSSYTDLVVIGFVRCTQAVSDADCKILFNSDTGANYSRTVVYGTGSAAGSTRNSDIAWGAAGSSASASTFSPCIFNFMNYSNTTTYKTCTYRYQLPTYVTANVGLWRSTSAITSIQFSPVTGNFDTGSTFTLYGIAAA